MHLLISILTVALMIAIHEFGHFITAKMLKVPVYEFSVGMGPKIFSVQGKRETKYSLRWFPIGGFCSFDDKDVTGIQDSALNKQPAWKRIIILFGGSGFNLISAFIVATILCGAIGLPGTSTTIYGTADERADAFLQAGDTIVAIDGVAVENFEDIETLFAKSDGTVNITVKRPDEGTGDVSEVSSDIKLFEYEGEWKMGVSMYSAFFKVPAAQVIPASFVYCKDTAYAILAPLAGLFNGSVHMSDMSGIVGVVDSMKDAAEEGFYNVVVYFILLSINLGLINLLPIPVLDGSKIVFCLIELVFRKKMSEKAEEVLVLTFAFLLIALMLYVTIQDITRIIP